MKILLISLSNVGDVVLTTPVISALKQKFPEAELDVLVGPRAKEIFLGDPAINEVFSYDKKIGLPGKLNLAFLLRKKSYDLVVDLRNSIFGPVANVKNIFNNLKNAPKGLAHMKDRHLWKIQQVVPGLNVENSNCYIWIDQQSKDEIDFKLLESQIDTNDLLIAVSPGARSHTKRWAQEGFIEVCERLSAELSAKVILVGDEDDKKITAEVMARAKGDVYDLAGQTSIKQLAALLQRCSLLISNDSAPMHIGYAVGTPVVAIFGPTDSDKYRPLGPKDVVIKKELPCLPCKKALCPLDTNECMNSIDPGEVFEAAKKILR